MQQQPRQNTTADTSLTQQVVWFMAKDVMKRDLTPFKERLDLHGIPTLWDPFTIEDSIRIENCYLKYKTGRDFVPAMIMDGLFEVDIANLEVCPVYWKGPIHEVRRGLWFEPKGTLFNRTRRSLYPL